MSRFAVIGLGYFGNEVAAALVARGHEVIAVDDDLARVEGASDRVHECVRLDATDPDALRAHRIHLADACVICMGDAFEETELTAVALASLGVKRIITRGTTSQRAKILRALGPEVVSPDVDSAERLADELTQPVYSSIRALGAGLYVAELPVDPKMDGARLDAIPLLSGLRVVALLRDGLDYEDGSPEGSFVAPPPETILREDDQLLLLGDERGIFGGS